MSNYNLASPVDVKSSASDAQINMYDSGGNFAVQVNAPAGLASNVDFTLPSTSGTSGQLLQRTGATSLGWVTKSGAPTGSSLPMQINFCTGNIPTTPLVRTVTGNVIVGYFIYSGSTASGPPSNFTMTYVSVFGTIISIIIIDLTHSSNVILSTTPAFAPGISSIPATARWTSPFTNIPTTQSLFRVNLNITSITTSFSVFSMSMN